MALVAWAKDGLHGHPGTTLAPFAAGGHVGVSGAGAGAWGRAGVLRCHGHRRGRVPALVGDMNPVAMDLAKPCAAWAVLLAVMNYNGEKMNWSQTSRGSRKNCAFPAPKSQVGLHRRNYN